MALTVPSILNKVLDNATLGKIIADFAPGLAFAIPFLMVVNLLTGASIMPADQIMTLEQDLKTLKSQLDEQKQPMVNVLGDVPALANEQPDISYTLEKLYALTVLYATDFDTQVKSIDKLIEKPTVDKNDELPIIDSMVAKRSELLPLHGRLESQKVVVDTLLERRKRLDNQLVKAHSFAVNVDTFTNNISLLLAFSIIFGVIISQFNRLLFVDRLYANKLEGDKDKVICVSVENQARFLSQEEKNNLVSEQYRYMEGSINMIWPVLAFGIVFPWYFCKRVSADLSIWLIVPFCILLVVALYYSGYATYKRYRKKEKAVCEAARAKAGLPKEDA